MDSNTPRPTLVTPPRVQTFSARLSEKQIYNDIYTLFHFELTTPPRIQFTAGQYVLLRVPNTPYRRSYSIASEPDLEHAIQLLVDLRPQGEATRYLGGLELGDEIEFMGPLGTFTVPPRDSEHGKEEDSLWFVATGSGIAPYRSMIEDLLVDDADARPITLVWGLRHAEHQFWYDEFMQLAEQHANFTFRPILSQPPAEWPLDRGRVTDILLAHQFEEEDLSRIGFFLCGGSSMIEDARAILQKRGVLEQQIHLEKFY